MRLAIGDRVAEVTVSGTKVLVDGVEYQAELEGGRLWLDGRVLAVRGERRELWLQGRRYQAREVAAGRSAAAPTTFDGRISATMPGTVLQLKVAVGERVEAGQALLLMESMKMEMTVETPGPGTVREVACAQGDLVAVGALLVRLEVESVG